MLFFHARFNFLKNQSQGYLKMKEGKDKRRAPRTSLKHANIYISENDTKIKGRIRDISPLGVRFVSKRPFSKETVFQTDPLLPDFTSFIDIPGRIVWCYKKRGDEYYSGMEFKGNYYRISVMEDYIKDMKLREKDYQRFNLKRN